jgi:hypothetical protein
MTSHKLDKIGYEYWPGETPLAVSAISCKPSNAFVCSLAHLEEPDEISQGNRTFCIPSPASPRLPYFDVPTEIRRHLYCTGGPPPPPGVTRGGPPIIPCC